MAKLSIRYVLALTAKEQYLLQTLEVLTPSVGSGPVVVTAEELLTIKRAVQNGEDSTNNIREAIWYALPSLEALEKIDAAV